MPPRAEGVLNSATSRSSGGAARAAIAAARRRFLVAMRKGDVKALLACYAERAVVVPQRSDVCRGRESIAKLFRAWLSSTTVREFDVKTEDLRLLPRAAVEVGTYRMVVESGTSGPVVDEGKFLIVYEREPNGAWLISRDMSVSNRP